MSAGVLRLVLAGAVLAVFGRVAWHGFVHWDDLIHITENPYLLPASPEGLLHFWVAPHIHLYMPVSFSVWWALAKLSGPQLDPHLFHITNLAVHLLTTLLVFGLLRALLATLDPPRRPAIDVAACAGALLFACHPLQAEPVAWATGLKDLLCGLFSVVALREYLSFRLSTAPGGRRHYALASLALLLALLSKPAGVVVPVMALAIDRLALQRPWRDSLRSLAVWFAASGLVAVVARAVQATEGGVFVPAMWQRPFIAGDALAFYLAKLVVPLGLGIDHGRTPQAVLSHGWGYLTWLLPAGLLAVALTRRRRAPWLLALALFAVAFAPVLGLVPFKHQKLSTVADRYAYLPMVGAALGAGFAFLRSGRIGRVLLTAVVTAFAAAASVQAGHWSDSESLFRQALRVNPRSVAGHYNLGLVFEQKGESEAALEQYRRVVEIDPHHPSALYNIGVHLAQAGRSDEAIRAYEAAIAADPTFTEAMVNLGVSYAALGDLERSAGWFARALEVEPDSRSAAANLEAIRALQRAAGAASATPSGASGLASDAPSETREEGPTR